jgi:hypothetical protein
VNYKCRTCPKYSTCSVHTDEQCKRYCEKCDIPVCSACVSFGNHKEQNTADIQEKFNSKTESLQRDLEELETRIFLRYEEMASDVESEIAELDRNYEILTTAVNEQEDVLHQEVTSIVNRQKTHIQEMKNEHISTLNNKADEISQRITEIKEIIANLKSILKWKDVSLTSTYKSRNYEFRTLPSKVQITMPMFCPCEINKDRFTEMFGFLSSLSITTKPGDTIQLPETLSSPVKPLLETPVLINTQIEIGYDGLFGVSCLSDEQIWTCGNNADIKLLSLGDISIRTLSGQVPCDIAVTRDGDLLYTDDSDKTVNLVRNDEIQTVISLHGWTPLYLCSTKSDCLLVTMISNDREQCKVVRYIGFKDEQHLQFDDWGHPLYSSDTSYKYISENKNLDICVADHTDNAVVVVKQSGKFRFRYTGKIGKSFFPAGIATDSHGHILIADYNDHLIHIIDQNGQFLSCIYNCGLQFPIGLCVDIRDNLYVAEYRNHAVKKIQYVLAPCVI